MNNAGIHTFKPFMEMSEEDWGKATKARLKSVLISKKSDFDAFKMGLAEVVSDSEEAKRYL